MIDCFGQYSSGVLVKGNVMTFRSPGEPPKDRLSDFLDRPVLIRPSEYQVMDTSMGQSLALMCQVLVPSPERGEGRSFNLGDKVPVFWKGVQSQLEESAGEWVLGRLHQGSKSNPKQFVFLPAEPGDEVVAAAALKVFEESWASGAGAPTPESEPF